MISGFIYPADILENWKQWFLSVFIQQISRRSPKERWLIKSTNSDDSRDLSRRKEDKNADFCFERERFIFDKELRNVRATNLQSRMIQIRGYKTFSSFLPTAQSCMHSHSTRTSIVHVFTHWINIRNRFGHLRSIFLHFLTVNLHSCLYKKVLIEWILRSKG